MKDFEKMEYSSKSDIKNALSKKRGRPRKIISGEAITDMVRCCIPLREIAKACGCCRDTIYFQYGEFVKRGQELWRQDRKQEFERHMSH